MAVSLVQALVVVKKRKVLFWQLWAGGSAHVHEARWRTKIDIVHQNLRNIVMAIRI